MFGLALKSAIRKNCFCARLVCLRINLCAENFQANTFIVLVPVFDKENLFLLE